MEVGLQAQLAHQHLHFAHACNRYRENLLQYFREQLDELEDGDNQEHRRELNQIAFDVEDLLQRLDYLEIGDDPQDSRDLSCESENDTAEEYKRRVNELEEIVDLRERYEDICIPAASSCIAKMNKTVIPNLELVVSAAE